MVLLAPLSTAISSELQTQAPLETLETEPHCGTREWRILGGRGLDARSGQEILRAFNTLFRFLGFGGLMLSAAPHRDVRAMYRTPRTLVRILISELCRIAPGAWRPSIHRHVRRIQPPLPPQITAPQNIQASPRYSPNFVLPLSFARGDGNRAAMAWTFFLFVRRPYCNPCFVINA